MKKQVSVILYKAIIICQILSYPINLILPYKEVKPIGIWGQRYLRYLKEYRRITYLNLLTSGRLNRYLAEIAGKRRKYFFGW